MFAKHSGTSWQTSLSNADIVENLKKGDDSQAGFGGMRCFFFFPTMTDDRFMDAFLWWTSEIMISSQSASNTYSKNTCVMSVSKYEKEVRPESNGTFCNLFFLRRLFLTLSVIQIIVHVKCRKSYKKVKVSAIWSSSHTENTAQDVPETPCQKSHL